VKGPRSERLAAALDSLWERGGGGARDTLRRRLVSGALGSYWLRIVNTGLALGYSIVLGRLLGAAAYGVYSYAIAWMQLLVVVASLGFGTLLVRDVARFTAQGDWCATRGLVRWTTAVGLVNSLIVMLLCAAVALAAGAAADPVTRALIVALALVPMLVLARLRQSALQGLHRVVAGQVPEMLARPLVFIGLIAVAYAFMPETLTPVGVIGLNGVSTAVALVLGMVLLRRSLPGAFWQARPRYEGRVWLLAGVSLFLVTGIRMMNAKVDTLMLGMLQGAEWVGIYTAANRAPELITFCLLAASASLSPAVASLYAKRDMARLQRVVTRGARIVLVGSLVVGGAFVVFGRWFLLLFGPDFVSGHTTLVILSISRILSASLGAVGMLLVMTGHERDVARAVAVGFVLNVALDWLLIPVLGMNGAAIGSASSMMVWNGILVAQVWRRLRINPTAFGHIGSAS